MPYTASVIVFAPGGKSMNNRSWFGGSGLFALALVGVVAPSALADTVRCGRKLLVEGDTLYDARSRCGEPDYQIHRVELRSARDYRQIPCANNNSGQCGQVVERTVEVVIDEWTYDFGPQQFIQYLIFEQGRLVRVLPGERGTKGKSRS
jgi:hypothetical protein